MSFTEQQIKTIEEGGFKVNSAGKITENGKIVKADLYEGILSGSIITNVDLAALRKTRARKAASGPDLVAALREISPEIEKLNVSQTARIPLPTEKVEINGEMKDPKRSFVMGVVTKLNNITVAGREWAGRNYESLSDDQYLYVVRHPDGEAKVRKAGAGRKKANSQDRLAAASAKVEEALDASNEAENEGTKAPEPTIEEATVISH